MSQDDRFFQENNAADDDADRTVFISRPASNRQRNRAGTPPGQPAFSQQNTAPPPIQQMRSPAVVSLHSDVNVIVSAATPLLTLGINARSMSHHPDPKALYQQTKVCQKKPS